MCLEPEVFQKFRKEYEMTQFCNDIYRERVSDFINDAFYVENLSNSGKIAIIRSYAEVVVRRILEFPVEEKLTLGDKEINQKLAKKSNNNSMLLRAVNVIRGNGGDFTHTQVVFAASEEIVENTLDCLFDLYAYLLIEYFERYKFGSNVEVVSSFSTLPPIIRYKTLKYLYEQDKENIMVIDKLSLAIVKTFDKQVALEWLQEHQEELKAMSCYSKEMQAEIKEKVGEAFLELVNMNMYDSCYRKIINIGENIEKKGKLYINFEESIDYYKRGGIVDGESSEIQEFNSVMEFLYLGRKSKSEL